MFLRKMTLKNTGGEGKIFHRNQNIPQLYYKLRYISAIKHLQGRNNMKKKVWALLLVFAVLVTTVNLPAVAGAEEDTDASGVVIKVKDDVNGSDTEESGGIQTVQISAQNQGNMDAVVRIFFVE